MNVYDLLSLKGKVAIVTGSARGIGAATLREFARHGYAVVGLDLLPEVALGDYILIHAGLAIARVDADHAQETLSLLRSLADEVY